METIAVSGTRVQLSTQQKEMIGNALSSIEEENILLVHGGATGVDSYAAEYARKRGWRVREYTANWKKYGKAAGPIRNKEMLTDAQPSILFAFPTVGSKGTYHTIRTAREMNIPTRTVNI